MVCQKLAGLLGENKHIILVFILQQDAIFKNQHSGRYGVFLSVLSLSETLGFVSSP